MTIRTDSDRLEWLWKHIELTVGVEFIGTFKRTASGALGALSSVRIDGVTGNYPSIREAIDAAMDEDEKYNTPCK